jgi:phage terminase small subunit
LIVSENERLTTKQRRFVAASLSALTVRDAAHLAGVSEPTAWRYLQSPAVRQELAERQDGILGHVARRLASEMGQALDVLSEVMQDEAANPAPRVSAAKAVLECGLRLAELVSLSERVAELERRQGNGT